MSVQFIPKNPDCFDFSVANKTWFTLANEALVGKDLKVSLQVQRTNDSIEITEFEADIFVILLTEWVELKDWNFDKQVFIDFFKQCGGFKTA